MLSDVYNNSSQSNLLSPRIKQPRKPLHLHNTFHFHHQFHLCKTTMSLQRFAFCVALLSRALLGCKASPFFTVYAEELSAVRDLQNRILDLIESPIRYYLRSDVDNADVDLNLMLGVSIMKGQFMSCTENYSGIRRYNADFYKMYKLNAMIGKLYVKFDRNNFMDSTRTIILDHKLWISPQTLQHKSNITLPAKIWFNEDILAHGDAYFRNISDKCIGQVISSCNVTYECFRLEFQKQFFGYALTHQVLYIHILKRMKCNNLKHRNVLQELIQQKCSIIFEEAQNMAKDLEMIDRYKDLFIEQIAVCGIQNMVDFFRPEWFSIIASSIKHNECIQHKNNKPSCDSHLTGVSLATLGVYWKFLCYKVNTYEEY